MPHIIDDLLKHSYSNRNNKMRKNFIFYALKHYKDYRITQNAPKIFQIFLIMLTLQFILVVWPSSHPNLANTLSSYAHNSSSNWATLRKAIHSKICGEYISKSHKISKLDKMETKIFPYLTYVPSTSLWNGEFGVPQ